MKFLILLFLYTLTVYANQDPPSSDVQFRIAGGEPANIEQVPYQVGLLVKLSSKREICGGALLSPTSILSAAHCFERKGVFKFDTKVVLGATKLYDKNKYFKTQNVVIHPNWNPKSFNHYDIAMVHLPPNLFSLSDTIQTIRLPTGSELTETFVGEKAEISGYGVTREGGKITQNQRLHKVSVFIVPNSECKLHNREGQVTDSHICTSGMGFVGTCEGDSGGPLVIHRNGVPVLVGVISFGGSCESRTPDGYTRVTSYIDWIKNNLTP